MFDYYIQPLHFSDTAMAAAQGNPPRYYLYKIKEKNGNPPLVMAAHLPGSPVIQKELEYHLRGGEHEGETNPSGKTKEASKAGPDDRDRIQCEWKTTAPGGFICIEWKGQTSCTYQPPVTSFVCDGPGGGGGGSGGDWSPEEECWPEDCFGGGGGGTNLPEEEPDPDKPCPGNPVKNPEIAPSGGWNEKGGQYGWTRSSGDQFHDGIDIKANLNSDLFAMHGGEVDDIRKSFDAGEYKKRSYGNYVRIKSTINGETVFLRYNHLNSVDVKIGDHIGAGDIIGKSWNTGNA